jgi:hypothetical protein
MPDPASRGKPRLASTGALLLAALLLPACGSHPTAGRVVLEFDTALDIDQVRVEVVLGTETLDTTDVPGRPGTALASGADVVVLFPDAFAGQQVVFHAAGLKAGAQVASGDVTLTLRAHATVVEHLQLVAVSCSVGAHACGAACFADDDPAHCGLACVACPAPAAHGTAVCRSSACDVQCSSSYTVCGSDCADLTADRSHCGDCDTACSGTKVCLDSQCQNNPCPSGNHPCSSTCVSDYDVSHCGTSCTPCPAPTGGTATCDGTSCGAACSIGAHQCGGACVSDFDVAHCGASCTACPAPTGSYATCDGVSCGQGCLTGYHACGGTCVDDTSIDTCGASCTPCPEPDHGSAECVSGVCQISCTSGYLPCAGGCVPQATGCVATWTDRTTTPAPSGRTRPAMAYDAGRGVTVLFGGFNNGGGINPVAYNDTWEWNGTAWQQITTATSPPVLSAAAMTYDPLRGTVVLFGGEDAAGYPVANTTWTYDGVTWTAHNVAGPTARSFTAMAWDGADGVAVLFGGDTGTTASVLMNDVWTWNGTAWLQRSLTGTPPTIRQGMSWIYDGHHQELVLFGGTSTAPTYTGLGDTWVTDLVAWTSAATTGPSARYGSACAYHAARQAGVLYSGTGDNGVTMPQDTWTWDGAAWSSLTTAGTLPPGRWRGGMVYDSGRGVIVLYGGTNATSYLQDTWELSW